MRVRPIIRGLLSYIPLLKKTLKKKGTGGSDSARYCYSVWLRHLIYLNNSGLHDLPQKIGEIGPGDSLGVGIAALLSGINEYYALDAILHADLKNNLTVLSDLINLFKQKSTIPDIDEFPLIKPLIDKIDFPSFLDYNKILFELDERSKKMRNDLSNPDATASIHYIAPWYNHSNIEPGSLDLIISQAVMEHILDLESAYKNMYSWLKPGGYISHNIDYRAHETDKKWFGHWAYSNFIWSIIMHGRKYPINRQPHSAHIALIQKAGFEIIKEQCYKNPDTISVDKIKFINVRFNADDLKIESAHIIARKN